MAAHSGGDSDAKHRRKRANRITALVTAGGGIARAAYARAVSAGLEVDALLRNAGLTLSQIRKPEVRIAVGNQIRFLNEVAGELSDEFLGFGLAQSVDLRELGLLYYVLASSENLQNALTRLARYSSIQNEGVHIGLSVGRNISISFEYVGVARASDRHQIEFVVAILLRLCRQLTARHLVPLSVHLAHRRSRIPPEIKRFFSCAVEFGSRMDQVVFSSDAKSLVLANADSHLNRLLQRYCDETLSTRRIKAGDWRLKVENVIAPLLPHGEATIESVAQKLGVSRRTLTRRLHVERVSFAEVLQALRLRLARQYLGEPGMTIAQAAWLLGYQEPSAFSHAFKRWTGRSPREARSGRG